MENKRLQIAGLITLASLGCVFIVTGLIVITHSLTLQSRTAASFLPAEQTIALLQSPNITTLEHIGHWFAEVTLLPATGSIEAVAIIESTSGSGHVVAVTRAPETLQSALADWHQLHSPPFTFFAQSPQALSHIAHDTGDRLLHYQPFATLARQHARQSSWVYLQRSALPNPADLADQLFRSLAFPVSRWLALSWTDNELTVHAFTTQGRPVTGLSSTVTQLTAHPRAVVTAHGGAALLSAVQRTLDENAQALWLSWWQTQTKQALGSDVSFVFDVQSLLTDAATLEMSQTASGQWLYTLQLNHPAVSQADLTTFHQVNQTDSTVIRERRLDDRFLSRDIRLNAPTDTITPKQARDWKLLQSTNEAGQILLTTGQAEDTMLLSTDPDIDQQLDEPTHWSLLENTSLKPLTILAGGRLPSSLAAWLHTHTGSLTSLVPPGDTVWTLTAQEHIRTLQIKRDQPLQEKSL